MKYCNAGWAVAWSLLLAGAAAAEAPVLVELLDEIQVAPGVVTLGEIAELSGGNGGIRDELSRVRIAMLGPGTKELNLTRRRVEVALRLSGLDESCELVGVDEVTVIAQRDRGVRRASLTRRVADDSPDDSAETSVETAGEEIGERRGARPASTGQLPLERQILEQVASRLQLEPSRVRVTLLSTPSGVSDEAILQPSITSVQLGAGQVRLRVWELGKFTGMSQVNCHIEAELPVVVSRRGVPAQRVLTEEDLVVESQWVDSGTAAPESVDLLLGRQLRQPVAAGVRVRLADTSEIRTQDQYVVRPRELATVVSRAGAVTVTLRNARVLDNGKIGDVVRFENPSTERVAYARVTGPGRLEIQ